MQVKSEKRFLVDESVDLKHFGPVEEVIMDSEQDNSKY